MIENKSYTYVLEWCPLKNTMHCMLYKIFKCFVPYDFSVGTCSLKYIK